MLLEQGCDAITLGPATGAAENLLHRRLVPIGPARDNRAMGWVGASVQRAIAMALPPRCGGCGAVIQHNHAFCAGCWSRLRFLGPPCCAGCGTPFAFDRGEGARCAECLMRPPRHAGVHAAVAYDEVARGIALRLKHSRRIGLAETMARLMTRRLPETAAVLVPVPLHRGRLWSRGFNQALLIAQAIGQRSRLPVERAVLVRHRATPMLRELGRRDRARAVRSAFSIARGRAAAVRGRHVVLVDDVYTSGATTDACTATLLRAGAAQVSILVWARVLDMADD